MIRRFGAYSVEITSPDRILFPKSKITKLDLINYYARVAPVMLPYMRNRLLTMHRFPEGINHEGFYHKDVPEFFPAWLKRVPIKKQEGGYVHYMVCNHTATLVYLAQAACITPHLFLSKIDKLDYPDQLIFDIDPSKNHDFDRVKQVALTLKALLESLNLIPFVKTTGSRGLHVCVPIKRNHTFDEVRDFAQQVAEVMQEHMPKVITLELRISKRGSNIFLDTLRNSFSATAVAPYAVRARETAPVATPLFWKELADKKLLSTTYNINNLFKRLDRVGDPWKDMHKSAKSLTSAIKLLAK